jgi:hypothetical protein
VSKQQLKSIGMTSTASLRAVQGLLRSRHSGLRHVGSLAALSGAQSSPLLCPRHPSPRPAALSPPLSSSFSSASPSSSSPPLATDRTDAEPKVRLHPCVGQGRQGSALTPSFPPSFPPSFLPSFPPSLLAPPWGPGPGPPSVSPSTYSSLLWHGGIDEAHAKLRGVAPILHQPGGQHDFLSRYETLPLVVGIKGGIF